MSKKIKLPKEHLSNTQIMMAIRCMEQYRHRYVENQIVPPGISQIKGLCMHEGIKHNNKQKIESKKDLPKNDVIDFSVSAFENIISKNGFILTKEEQDKGKKKVLGTAKDSVAKISEKYIADVAPAIQPILVEQKIVIQIPKLAEIVTIIDVVDNQNNIIDYKYSSKSKNQSEIDNSIQMTLYALAYMSYKKMNINNGSINVVLDVIVEGSKNLKYQRLSSQRNFKHFVATQMIIDSVIQNIFQSLKTGKFLPNGLGSWACSPKFCGYYMDCKYVTK